MHKDCYELDNTNNTTGCPKNVCLVCVGDVDGGAVLLIVSIFIQLHRIGFKVLSYNIVE